MAWQLIWKAWSVLMLHVGQMRCIGMSVLSVPARYLMPVPGVVGDHRSVVHTHMRIGH